MLDSAVADYIAVAVDIAAAAAVAAAVVVVVAVAVAVVVAAVVQIAPFEQTFQTASRKKRRTSCRREAARRILSSKLPQLFSSINLIYLWRRRPIRLHFSHTKLLCLYTSLL